jgi:cysteine desulfuration protein SufE
MQQAPTIHQEQELIREEFELFDDWREKIEYVMDLGRQLRPFPEEHRLQQNKVKGCQSQVWMVADLEDGRLRLHADSDSMLVRGLIGLLLRLYDDRPPEEVLAHPPEVIETVGLGSQLTPGRQNGLWAMVKRIREIAAAYAGAVPAK